MNKTICVFSQGSNNATVYPVCFKMETKNENIYKLGSNSYYIAINTASLTGFVSKLKQKLKKPFKK